ncbi:MULTISPECIES: chloramphenicol phosphotransferase CPT family protein [unclassified Photobacterium]|uniref:chloramphenicol phosphotransferase CPT family protein n=1 Tax=unclassified Photobacterium TaxID=2628852 RepID=UPI001EDF2472|nr:MULTISPECIES: chloramphenicol phosphotransferase CPT family protein [unclassified Photobacterium]MCG3862727.1 chloramphenicol phosphotransferase [Photobacterium sp. Ph6]MCG3874258.1 chloramphenicol phosphotransferase [Photobacterium sp. Ph5]
MYPDVILLNGTGSAGKTSLAKELQELLSIQYLNFSIDSVLYALPPTDLRKMIEGNHINRSGYDYGQLTEGYHNSVKGLLEAGCKLIVDNAWINEDEINALEKTLNGYHVVRVKVMCQLDICIARELARGDRAIGLAESEYPLVHQFMNYDVTVDTSDIQPKEAAIQLLKQLELC